MSDMEAAIQAWLVLTVCTFRFDERRLCCMVLTEKPKSDALPCH